MILKTMVSEGKKNHCPTFSGLPKSSLGPPEKGEEDRKKGWKRPEKADFQERRPDTP